MLENYEYLLRTHDLALKRFGIAIHDNLEKFPVDLAPSLRQYHEKIVAYRSGPRDAHAASCRRPPAASPWRVALRCVALRLIIEPDLALSEPVLAAGLVIASCGKRAPVACGEDAPWQP